MADREVRISREEAAARCKEMRSANATIPEVLAAIRSWGFSRVEAETILTAGYDLKPLQDKVIVHYSGVWQGPNLDSDGRQPPSRPAAPERLTCENEAQARIIKEALEMIGIRTDRIAVVIQEKKKRR